MKKLVPYGSPLKSRLINSGPIKNDVYLFIGNHAWEKAKNFQTSRPGTLCLPPFYDPSIYEWPVPNCDILIFDTGFCDQDYIDAIVKILFRSNANIVRYVSSDFKTTIFKKDF